MKLETINWSQCFGRQKLSFTVIRLTLKESHSCLRTRYLVPFVSFFSYFFLNLTLKTTIRSDSLFCFISLSLHKFTAAQYMFCIWILFPFLLPWRKWLHFIVVFICPFTNGTKGSSLLKNVIINVLFERWTNVRRLYNSLRKPWCSYNYVVMISSWPMSVCSQLLNRLRYLNRVWL